MDTENAPCQISSDMKVCLCGCGRIPSGKKSKFAAGHDARMKGRLGRAMRTLDELSPLEDPRLPRQIVDYAEANLEGQICGYSCRDIIDLSKEVGVVEQSLTVD